MATEVIKSDNINTYASDLSRAAQSLRAGSLVVFPTETVYGVAANVAVPAALQRLRDVKGRTPEQPFTVHLGQRRDARRYLTAPSPLTRRLARKGWPGPLTLICHEPDPERTEVAGELPTGQLREIYRDGRVGLRCPDHPVAARLLSEAQAPIVASSANRHGNQPPTDATEALRDLDGAVEYAIDAGPTRHAGSSTIVVVDGQRWSVQRAGAIDERTIARWARSEVLFVCTGNSCRSPMAEALFRARLAEALGLTPAELIDAGYAVSSAGTMGMEGMPASGGSLEEMTRRGIDLSAHRSSGLSAERIHQAERVFGMSPEHVEEVLATAPAAAHKVALLDANAPIADPIGGTAEDYARCASQIESAIDARLKEFLDEDRDW